METTTQFDLNQAIQRWRGTLAQSPAFQPENLEELEGHLRDSIAPLQRGGLSEPEAFQIATQRLGGAAQLHTEFCKTNAADVWRDRGLWMLVGLLFYGLVADLTKAIQAGLVWSAAAVTDDGFTLGWLSGGLRLALFGLTVWAFSRMATGRIGGLERWKSAFHQRPALWVAIFSGLQLLLMAASGGLSLLNDSQLNPVALGQRALVDSFFGMMLPVAHTVFVVAGVVWLGVNRSKGFAAPRLGTGLLLAGVMLSSSSMTTLAQTKTESTPVQPSAKKATLDNALKLWRAGQQTEAVDQFLAVDFSKQPLFPAGSTLNLTEAEFVALPTAAREKMRMPMMEDIQTLKLIAAQVKAQSKTSEKSALCLSQLKAAGEAFDRPGGLALLKLVGQAMKKMAIARP